MKWIFLVIGLLLGFVGGAGGVMYLRENQALAAFRMLHLAR